MKNYLRLLIILFVFWGCADIEKVPESTWGTIQEKILKTSCINCHVSGSAMTKQSGLDLSGNDSYGKLVGVSPKNIAAKNDGLVIVSNEGGMKLSLIHISEPTRPY